MITVTINVLVVSCLCVLSIPVGFIAWNVLVMYALYGGGRDGGKSQ